MQPWIDACADIFAGLAIITAVAAVFVIAPLATQARRARRDSRRYALGPQDWR